MRNEIFNINSNEQFKNEALKVFNYQYKNNKVYQSFCQLLNVQPNQVKNIAEIPFLPIQFFKSHKIVSSTQKEQQFFSSSGTTGSLTSKHYVTDLTIYENSYLKAFTQFYGNIKDYTVLALLPSYLERDGSSLIYMVNDLIKKSNKLESGFYLHNLSDLKNVLIALDANGEKVILIGVSFALLDLVEKFQFQLQNTIVMETGGMKGRRKELIRVELHDILKNGFGLDKIHSEYGMTELLSQAYSHGNGVFNTPPWMKILIRDTEDPLRLLANNQTGGINIIDLANINSCAFIATQDLGKIYSNNSFEVLGRFDNSDIRGCNLLAN